MYINELPSPVKNQKIVIFRLFHVLMRNKPPPESECAHYEVKNLGLVVGFQFVNGVLISE